MTQTRPNLGFAVLAVVQATLIFTIALITVPLPEIAIAFSLGSTELLLLQVAYGLPFSGLLLFGGRLADRFGGRRMLLAGGWCSSAWHRLEPRSLPATRR